MTNPKDSLPPEVLKLLRDPTEAEKAKQDAFGKEFEEAAAQFRKDFGLRESQPLFDWSQHGIEVEPVDHEKLRAQIEGRLRKPEPKPEPPASVDRSEVAEATLQAAPTPAPEPNAKVLVKPAESSDARITDLIVRPLPSGDRRAPTMVTPPPGAKKRRVWPWVVGGVLLVGAGGAVLAASLGGTDSSPSAVNPSSATPPAQATTPVTATETAIEPTVSAPSSATTSSGRPASTSARVSSAPSVTSAATPPTTTSVRPPSSSGDKPLFPTPGDEPLFQ